jgi:hypothetical protein
LIKLEDDSNFSPPAVPSFTARARIFSNSRHKFPTASHCPVEIEISILHPTMKLLYSLFATALAAPAVSAEIYFKEQFNDDVSVVRRHLLAGLQHLFVDKWKSHCWDKLMG